MAAARDRPSGELRYVVYRESQDLPWSEGEPSAVPRAVIMGGKKLAVLVGVSKYTRRPKKRMSDLEYADDDIVMWFTYLRQKGYECKVFGDEFSPYPQWDGPATVRNVRQAVQDMVHEAHRPEDHVVFVTSSHGSGDGRGLGGVGVALVGSGWDVSSCEGCTRGGVLRCELVSVRRQ